MQPANTDSYPIGDGMTLEQLIELIGVPREKTQLAFINGAQAKPDTVLGDGDAIRLFPYLGGG